MLNIYNFFLTLGKILIFSILLLELPSFALELDQQNQLQKALDEVCKSYDFPGAQVGIWSPKGSWVGSCGHAGPDQKRAITRADHTRIGSVTKTFTVTALLKLFEQEKLSLQDKIEKYVSDIPNAQATLWQLATMTSGIPSYTKSEKCTAAYFANPSKVFQPEQLIDCIRKEKANFQPGEKFEYSNTNTVLLGMVIEKVSGLTLEQAFRKFIYEPLGLKNTSYPGSSSKIPKPHLSGISEQGEPAHQIKNATFFSPTFTGAAGEMISTLDDLHAWAVALGTGEKILKPQTQKIRLASLDSNLPPNTPERSYGLGIVRTNGWLGHTGELPGFNTMVQYNPKLQTTVVIMVNSDIGRDNISPADAIFKKISSIIAN